jgi:Holliday junction resolvasome RuvABC endonuclease subunit
MVIIGVDYSLSCPAACALGPTFKESKLIFIANRKRDITSNNILAIPHTDYTTEQERHDNLSNTIIQFIQNYMAPVVYIEDYSFGSKGRIFNIAEATGLFKHKLHRLGIELHTVAPTVVKKFATGKGNSDKQAMYNAFVAQGNPDLMKWYYDKDVKVGSPVSDIIDAYYIAKYGNTIHKAPD